MGEDTYVGPVPGRVLVDVMMGMWGGLFCLLVVDLLSRFAGLPIPGGVASLSQLPCRAPRKEFKARAHGPVRPSAQMLPFLVLGFVCFSMFGALLLLASKPVALPELVVAAVSFVVAVLLLMDAACCLLCRSYRNAPPIAALP